MNLLVRIYGKRIKQMAATALLLSMASAKATAQFEARSSSPVVYEPRSLVVADFNHDGKLDVAAAVWYTGRVAVLFGRGDGSFQPAVYYTIDSRLESVYSITAADFNGDGNADLAVADFLGSNISILLGNGDGTFQPPIQYPITKPPTFVASGDSNGDGTADLIVADYPYVSVLLGNGDGTFQRPLDNDSYSSTVLHPLALGDFNHDGNLDVAAITPPGTLGLGILLGNGDGTFRAGAQLGVGGVIAVTSGDFNGDQDLDLAVSGGNEIEILLGNGDGTFKLESSIVSSQPAAVTTADVNGDDKLDLVFFTSTLLGGVCQITVMLGNGNGTFQQSAGYSSCDQPSDIALGDFNGDQEQDLGVADFRAETVDVLLNTGVVSFSPSTVLSFSPQVVGTTSAPQNVTLKNKGKTTLSIAGMSINKPFHFGSGTTCSTSVAAGGSCILSVVFQPAVIGLQSGLIKISDSASSKSQAIELRGTGVH